MEARLAEYVVDKSDWGDGPWQQEPDRVDFVHAGFACLALRQSQLGHWCGYVGVPREHPAYGKKAGDVKARFHRGLDYAAPCNGLACHIPEPGMSDDVWWVGGDFAHAFDLTPAHPAVLRQIRGISGRYETYRDLPYARRCIESLAEQLAAMQLAKTRRSAGQL